MATEPKITPEDGARGARIRSAYEAKGWNRAEFHRRMAEKQQPLQYHTVASWDTGAAVPDSQRLVHIEELTGVSILFLMTGRTSASEASETVPQIVEDFIASNARVTPDQADRLRRTRWKSLASSLGIELSLGFVRNAWLEMVDSTGQAVEKPKRRPGAREMPPSAKK